MFTNDFSNRLIMKDNKTISNSTNRLMLILVESLKLIISVCNKKAKCDYLHSKENPIDV